MTTDPPIVEQRHRDAAAAFFERRAENMVLTADLDIRFRNLADWIRAGHKDTLPEVQAFARFDTARTAELEREIAALRELLASARTGLSVLLDTAADFTQVDQENCRQAHSLIGEIDTTLGGQP